MKKESIDLIEHILVSDESVCAEMRDSLLRAMRQAVPRRKLVSAKEAQAMLGVSRPTLRAYVKRGVLEQVNISARKVRFDEQEVSRLHIGVSKNWKGVKNRRKMNFTLKV